MERDLQRLHERRRAAPAAAGDASNCPVLNGGSGETAALLQQMARSQAEAQAGPLLGTDRSGAAVLATAADVVEAELAMAEWTLKKARQRGAAPPPELLEQRDALRARLAELQPPRRGWFR